MGEQQYRVIMRQGSFEEDAYPGSAWDRETCERMASRLNASPMLPREAVYVVVPVATAS